MKKAISLLLLIACISLTVSCGEKSGDDSNVVQTQTSNTDMATTEEVEQYPYGVETYDGYEFRILNLVDDL